MKVRLFLVYTSVIVVAYTQDCKVGGKWCSDHEQCCGGCCFNGECIDTYSSCLTAFDACADHTCMGEENCVVYVPPECPGCEPIPLCRVTQ